VSALARALTRALARAAALAGLVAAAPAAAHAPALPDSALAVRGRDGAWRAWWAAERAPARWAGPLAAVAGAVRWQGVAPGVERGELAVAGTGEAWRLRVQLVRIDPRRAALRLHALVGADGRARPWRVDSAPPAARVALNAGQFDGGGPWGWVVHEGAEWRAPGAGALAPAVVVDTAGRVRLVPPDSIAAVRAELGAAACARRSSRTPRCSSATARCPRRCRRRGAAWTWRTATRASRSACCATGACSSR
jgi:hypothetical protein